MIISIDVEKTLDKIKYLFIINKENSQQTQNRRKLLQPDER